MSDCADPSQSQAWHYKIKRRQNRGKYCIYVHSKGNCKPPHRGHSTSKKNLGSNFLSPSVQPSTPQAGRLGSLGLGRSQFPPTVGFQIRQEKGTTTRTEVLWELECLVIPREQVVTPGQTRDGQQCWDSSLGPLARYVESWQQGGDPVERTGRQSRGSGVCARMRAAEHRLCVFWVFFFLLDASTCHSLPDSSLLLTGHLDLFLWLWIQKPRIVPTEQP